MATYIKTLKEDNGDITYPQTKAGAVLLNNGSDLETELSQYVTAEDIASTSALTPPVQTNMIANGAVTSAKINWTTLWSGELKNYKTGTGNAITLSESISNFKYVDFIIRLTNWTDNDTNVVFRHYVGVMNYSAGSCNVSVFYAFSGNTANVRCGTLRFDGKTLYWDVNRSLSINWSASTTAVVTDISDGTAISLIRVVGYR